MKTLFFRFALFLLACSLLLLSIDARADSSDERSEIPFLNYDDFKDLLGGTFLDVWNPKWKDADKSVYSGDLKQEIEGDMAGVKSRYIAYKRWKLPAVLAAVKINPKNRLLYFLLEPGNGDEISDGNIVYIYDPGRKRVVCKTAVSLMQ